MNQINSNNPGVGLQRSGAQTKAKPESINSALVPEDTVSLGSKTAPEGLWRTYSNESSSSMLALRGVFLSGARNDSQRENFEKIETSDGTLVSYDSDNEKSTNYSYAKGLFSGERGAGWSKSSWGRQYRQH